MNKSFDQLKDYREKYKTYLINPEAVLDETTRLVSPHVFVFPYKMFKTVELREHFAPFYVIFKFDGEEQLQKMMQDERVQEKTMYASVLGGPGASVDLDSAVQVLRETRHSVIVNDSLFGDLHANMPYGGRGASTSLVVNTSYNPKTGLETTMGHRPKLVSLEAFTAFGSPRIKAQPRLLSQDYFTNALRSMLIQAEQKSDSLEYFYPIWKTLQMPLTTSRPRGVRALREIIQKDGFKIVTDRSQMNAKEREEFIEFYGAEPLLTSGRKLAAPLSVPGVLFHAGGIGQGPKLLNRARGEANPHLGWGNLHGLFNGNKFAEYILTEAVQPGIMAPTESIGTLNRAGVLSSEFQKKRDQVIQDIQQVTQKRSSVDEALTENMIQMLEVFFRDLRQYYPQGAYLKNFGEFGTADLGTQVTTFSTPAKMIVSEYLRRLKWAATNSSRPISRLSNPAFQKLMLSNIWEIGTAFMQKLLTAPDTMLAQSRVKIAKTPMGFPMEIRVDFVDGEALYSRNRFSYEYLPNELQEASLVLNHFFAKAPEQFRYLSGGADIAKLADGSWVIVEFNVGAESGTLEPGYFTFEYHNLISNLTGRRTQWLTKMEDIYTQGLESQIKYLKTLKYVRPLFWKGNGLSDLSVTEVGRYFRDLDLKAWTQNPTPENAVFVLNKIKAMLHNWEDQENVRNLIISADNFMRHYKPTTASF